MLVIAKASVMITCNNTGTWHSMQCSQHGVAKANARAFMCMASLSVYSVSSSNNRVRSSFTLLQQRCLGQACSMALDKFGQSGQRFDPIIALHCCSMKHEAAKAIFWHLRHAHVGEGSIYCVCTKGCGQYYQYSKGARSI